MAGGLLLGLLQNSLACSINELFQNRAGQGDADGSLLGFSSMPTVRNFSSVSFAMAGGCKTFWTSVKQHTFYYI